MAKSVQVFARVSPEERELIKACGGLQIIVRRFLADKSGEEEKHLAAIKELQARIAEEQGEINRHAEIIEKLKVQREHNKKTTAMPPERSLTQFRNRRVAAKISTPKEWESKFKIVYLMLFAMNGKLSAADEQTIMKHMGLHPPETAAGWLHTPTPEKMSLEALEKCRASEPLGLLSLKREGRINEHLYKLLMMWLSLPTKESVDDWILKGSGDLNRADGGTQEQKAGAE